MLEQTLELGTGNRALSNFFQSNSVQIGRAFDTDFPRNKIFFGREQVFLPEVLSHKLGFLDETIDDVHKLVCTQIVMAPMVRLLLRVFCKNNNMLVGEILKGDRSMYVYFDSESEDEIVRIKKRLSLVNPLDITNETQLKTQLVINMDANTIHFYVVKQ